MNEFFSAFATVLLASIASLLYTRLLSRARRPDTNITHNLPSPSSQFFIGRVNAIEKLKEFLSPKNLNAIAGVFGMAGIGKTTLLIELGRIVVESKSFELVLYIPARQFSLSESQNANDGMLETIISTVIYSIDSQKIKLSSSEKEAFVRAFFSQRRTLLLIDGLDEIDEKEKNELLKFLSSLPSQTKTIISSRHKINLSFTVQLEELTFDEFRTLLLNELPSTDITKLSNDIVENLFHLTGGLPLAAKWAASLLRDYSTDTVISKFKQGNNSLFELAIEPVISKFRNKYPYNELLMTLAHLPDLATIQEIAYKAGLEEKIQLVEEGVVALTQVSLLNKSGEMYIMHPLTKEYILSREKSW